MKEILFRVWCKNKNEWEQDMPVLTFDGRLIDLQHHMELNQENHIVMQYTGLKDKNGVEIYEGDIVKTNLPYYEKASVLWDYEFTGFYLKAKSNDGSIMDMDLDIKLISIEVIGNIYDNPELLEGTTK